MKKLQLLLLGITATVACQAQMTDRIYRPDMTSGGYQRLVEAEAPTFSDKIKKLIERLKAESDGDESDEKLYFDLTVTEPGQLVDIIDNEITQADSLVVRGPINAEDLSALWSLSFFNSLSVINLEYAMIEDGLIPDRAFYNYNEQYKPTEGYTECIRLRRIILPECVTRIGEWAFALAINLEEINIPQSLKSIESSAFVDCRKLKADHLIFPEGFEKVGDYAFYQCYALASAITFPSTLRYIHEFAFYHTKITSVTVPEGLTHIGTYAFTSCHLKSITLPNTCHSIGNNVFHSNWELESATFPEGITSIPDYTFCNCFTLKEFTIPSTVESIGDRAFWYCQTIKSLTIPEGVESIGYGAFDDMENMEEIAFPSTLKSLGVESCCDWKGVKKIYCAATEPPVCVPNSKGYSPFGDKNNTHYDRRTPQETPVYIPIGTTEKYKNAVGWDYFNTFIETDQFPTLASVTEIAADQHDDIDQPIYDLMGRRVEHPTNGQIYIKGGRKFIYSKR